MSLLNLLNKQVVLEIDECIEITNEEYKQMVEEGNDIIRGKQQKYYEAYSSASKVNIG